MSILRRMRLIGLMSLASVAILSLPTSISAQAMGLPELSEKTRECIDCHKKKSPGIYQQWGRSKHYRGNVGCSVPCGRKV